MDYAALPPEVNSLRMYAGPGSGPMLAAATAWDGLAVELSTAAGNYGSTITDLCSGPWRGPASKSMVAAAAPYVGWMRATAARAAQTAGQARAAAGAYEAAFAMTVPPPVIAANRALLASLIATNLVGQNTPAIATTEADYAEMWARDAAAMYGYAASSAAAATLHPFTEAPATTSGDGTASAAPATLSHLLSQIPGAIQELALPGLGGAGPAAALSDIEGWVGLGGVDVSSPAGILNFLFGADGSPLGAALSGIGLNTLSSGFYTPGNFLGTLADVLGFEGADAAAEAAGEAAGAAGAASGELGSVAGGLGGAMSAGVGNAASIGPLSVPPAWASAVQPIGTVASASPTAEAAAPPIRHGLANTFGGVPLVGSSGRAVTDIPRYGFRPTMVTHPPAAG